MMPMHTVAIPRDMSITRFVLKLYHLFFFFTSFRSKSLITTDESTSSPLAFRPNIPASRNDFCIRFDSWRRSGISSTFPRLIPFALLRRSLFARAISSDSSISTGCTPSATSPRPAGRPSARRFAVGVESTSQSPRYAPPSRMWRPDGLYAPVRPIYPLP